jgi:SAM-dependent methyltransferase
VLDELTVKHDLPDHSDINEERYPWSRGMLSTPAFYAARLWEYAYSILSADLQPGMKVADIGCGMTAFTIYLKDHAGCDTTGVDPDIFDSGIKYKGHGVNQEFLSNTGLKVVQGEMTDIPLETDSQDRAFCISVMEHVSPDVRLRGMREMARILKPGGLAILTVDMAMTFTLNRPLDMIWDSGLQIHGPFDFRWPVRRLGMFSGTDSPPLPADVLGMVLIKDSTPIDIQYRPQGESVPTIPLYRVPTLIPIPVPPTIMQRVRGRLSRELQKVRGKQQQ